MPYKVEQGVAGCKGYAVVNDKGELKGCHSGRSAALAQMRAGNNLYMGPFQGSLFYWL